MYKKIYILSKYIYFIFILLIIKYLKYDIIIISDHIIKKIKLILLNYYLNIEIITPFSVNIGTLYYLVFSSYLFIKSFACINKYLK